MIYGLYLVALVALWGSSKVVVGATEKLAKYVSVPPFILSFVVLGMMTSTPEIGLLINSSIKNADEVYVGNLLGGIFTLFGLVIPLLVILKDRLSVNVEMRSGMLGEIVLLLAYPVITTIDGKLYWYEGLICVLSYLALVAYFLKKQHLFIKVTNKGFVKIEILSTVAMMGVGLFVLMLASKILVGAIQSLSATFSMSEYMFSFVFSPIATNLPEISIILQSLSSKKVEVALGDYLGSASANVILLGIGVLVSGNTVSIPGGVVQKALYVAVLLGAFYFFAKSDRSLSKKEGIIMLAGYGVFLILELILKR